MTDLSPHQNIRQNPWWSGSRTKAGWQLYPGAWCQTWARFGKTGVWVLIGMESMEPAND